MGNGVGGTRPRVGDWKGPVCSCFRRSNWDWNLGVARLVNSITAARVLETYRRSIFIGTARSDDDLPLRHSKFDFSDNTIPLGVNFWTVLEESARLRTGRIDVLSPPHIRVGSTQRQLTLFQQGQ